MEFSNIVLNAALRMSMEFGENWLLSIDERLLELYPELGEAAVLKIDKICREANKNAHKFVCEHKVQEADGISFVAFPLFETFMISKYDWIDEENLSRIYSQGCYYALR